MIILSSLEFLLAKVFHPIPPGIRGVICGIPLPRGAQELQQEIQYCGDSATHYTLITKNITGEKLFLYVCQHHIKDLDLKTKKPKPKEPS